MTNQYMTKLYHDLLSNSPQTVTIDIPADMGTGQISQVVTKQGAVVSDWKMNYFSDMNVQGVSCEDYIQLLFCFNDGVSWNIADARQSVSIQKGESCIYRGHGKMEYLCYSGKTDFLFKNIKSFYAFNALWLRPRVMFAGRLSPQKARGAGSPLFPLRTPALGYPEKPGKPSAGKKRSPPGETALHGSRRPPGFRCSLPSVYHCKRPVNHRGAQ